METKSFEKFVENLKDILDYPPYLIFVFVGSIFVLVSLATENFFEKTWIFFLYSAGGAVWRYIEKDLDHGIGKALKEGKSRDISHLVVISIYHIGNLGLFLALLHYLKSL